MSWNINGFKRTFFLSGAITTLACISSCSENTVGSSSSAEVNGQPNLYDVAASVSTNANYELATVPMTSATTPAPYIVTTNSNFSSTYVGWKAFDASAGWSAWMSGNLFRPVTGTANIQIEFPEAVEILEYHIRGRYDVLKDRLPKTWALQGTNDLSASVNDGYNDLKWHPVDARSDVNPGEEWSSTGTMAEVKYATSYPSPYKKYRLIVIAVNGSSIVDIQEIELFRKKAPVVETGAFTDTRDNQSYGWVKIGGQTWMSENLKYASVNSACYANNSVNCTNYGRLYTWAEAMNNAGSSTVTPSGVQGQCPTGWHLPSVAEWRQMWYYIAAKEDVGAGSCFDSYCEVGLFLKTVNGWTGDNANLDSYGFHAKAGGWGIEDWNLFRQIGFAGIWWATDLDATGFAGNIGLQGDYTLIDVDFLDPTYLHSVRCVKN